jgi:hypothetical protein
MQKRCEMEMRDARMAHNKAEKSFLPIGRAFLIHISRRRIALQRRISSALLLMRQRCARCVVIWGDKRTADKPLKRTHRSVLVSRS